MDLAAKLRCLHGVCKYCVCGAPLSIEVYTCTFRIAKNLLCVCVCARVSIRILQTTIRRAGMRQADKMLQWTLSLSLHSHSVLLTLQQISHAEPHACYTFYASWRRGLRFFNSAHLHTHFWKWQVDAFNVQLFWFQFLRQKQEITKFWALLVLDFLNWFFAIWTVRYTFASMNKVEDGEMAVHLVFYFGLCDYHKLR